MTINKNMAQRPWNNRYHLILVPKKRMKVVFIGGNLRRYLGNFLHEPSRQKSIVIMEGNLMNCSSVGYYPNSPKNIHPRMVGYLKGKGTMEIARDFNRTQKPEHKKNYYARKYFISDLDSEYGLQTKEYSEADETEDSYFSQSSWI